MDIGALYEPPFTDLHTEGPEGLFTEPDIDELVHIIRGINNNANFPANAPPERTTSSVEETVP